MEESNRLIADPTTFPEFPNCTKNILLENEFAYNNSEMELVPNPSCLGSIATTAFIQNDLPQTIAPTETPDTSLSMTTSPHNNNNNINNNLNNFETTPFDGFNNLNRFLEVPPVDLNQTSNPDPDNSVNMLMPDVLGQKRKNSPNSADESSKIKKPTSNLPIDDKNKTANLRKNIRDVMNETQLDTTTLAAQREESERLARVAGQQKSMRDLQRQMAVNRQILRTQNRVPPLSQAASSTLTNNDLEALSILPEFKKINTFEMESNSEENISSGKLSKTDENDSSSNTIISNETESTQLPQEVVTIEDSSSDDDCILLSDEEYDDADDGNNSGLHVKDAYNVPDELGRVLVNVGHPEGEDNIYLAPQIAKIIKPHQVGGVRFLYDNIIESTKRFKKSSGFGCILAHSMGLGKTLQVVSFCDIFLRHTPAKNVLCVMPINTLQNWLSEFNMWIPNNSLDHNFVRPRHFDIYVLNDQQKTLHARAKVILNWAQEGGVLLIGYELFRLLALKLVPNRKKRNNKNAYNDGMSDASSDLMDNIHKALVKPGPDLIICDEGHRIKNAHAGISVALKQIRTRRRIVLTGYPLQNNLLEYWCMVDFVRPNYLGTRTEFCNMFERPIQNGQCIDSTPDDKKLMRYRAHVLHSLLLGFVQRRSHEVLQKTLPEKLEHVILVRMTSFQRKLYDTFMNDVVRKKAFPNPLKAFAVCCKIWNHPDVLYNFLKECETDLDLEIDEDPTTTTSTITPPTTKGSTTDLNLISDPNINQSCTDISNNSVCSTSNNSIINQTNSYGKPAILSDVKLINPSIVPPTRNDFMQPMKADERSLSSSGFNSQPKYNEISKSCGMNYYPGNEDQLNNFAAYQTDNKSSNYWMDTTNIYKPNYVGMMVKRTGENLTSDLENVTGSSEIVDLDTNEIKTVETDIDSIQTKPVISNFQDTGNDKTKILDDTDSTTLSTQKDLTAPIIDKKLLKPKRCDEFLCTWAVDIMKNYEPGIIANSPKMEIFFCILKESIYMGDRVLLFSQSLLTLNLIEGFLKSNYIPGSNIFWSRNSSYFRLDGSTSSQERERLVNEFNSNPNVKLFLISTRAGSLGINLTGANRVVVFDASWNPCHDTQAVYRIYRYGQKKSCYIYRIVMDRCLEKKIYDRQIKKQGMSDRVVDECNPDAHLSLKDVTNLCHDYDTDEEGAAADSSSPSHQTETFSDSIIEKIVKFHKKDITKDPFFHESLLIDRKDRQLSQAEKRQAHRSYEMEKKASIRPMQNKKFQNVSNSTGARSTRWIPAEVWQRQGMTAQEMTLPLDVVIPTNSVEKSNIILKAGQRVMVLKSSKGIYMQLDSGKIIAIRTTSKAPERDKDGKGDVIDITSDCDADNVKLKSTTNTIGKCIEEPAKATARPDVKQTLESSNAAETTKEEISKHKVNNLPTISSPIAVETKPPLTTVEVRSNATTKPIEAPPAPPSVPVPVPVQSQNNDQQLYKHQTPYVSSQYHPTQHLPQYNNSTISNLQNSIPPSTPVVVNAENNITAATAATSSNFCPPRDMHPSYPPQQYYDYYDNNNKSAAACNYQFSDYPAAYSHFNYSPYHTHLHPAATAAYGSTASSAYIGPNAFQRHHWSPVVNPPTSNHESFRAHSSAFTGSGCQPNEWPSQ